MRTYRTHRLTFTMRARYCAVGTMIFTRVYRENVRWMGRGPTIQGRKNAVDVVRCSHRDTTDAVDDMDVSIDR